MFNSPSSRLTPRRGPTPARPRDSISSSARPRPSLFPETLPPPTPSIRSSRLAVSRSPPSPTSSAGETTRTVREYDPAERAIWARDDRFEVHSAGNVPREAQALVKKADFVTNTVSGHVDPVSGFAFIATPERCVAWNYQKRTHSSPTCYTFPAPPSYAHSAQVPVLAALYPGAAEPGMILVGPSGEVRFWDNVGIASANVDRYTALDLESAEDDFAERLFRVDGSNYIITTTSASAFRLTITAQAGRVVPSSTPLTRPGGMFGRANPTIFPRSERGEGVTAVASSGGATFLLSGRIMQKWLLTPEHHRFVQEWDSQDIFEREFSQDSLVQSRDLVPCGHKLAALASYTEEQSTSYAQTHSYAIHSFSVHNGSLQTDRIIPLVYQPPSDARALDAPRSFVPASSPTAFVRFANAVVLVSLDDDYEDVISLKDAGRNAFIGVGCVTAPSSSRRIAAPALTLMPIFGGLVEVDIVDGPTAEKSATASLKSKIEQAVFYGDRSDNPLSFDLSPDAPGDIAAAAEQVSGEILASTSAHQPASYELKPLLLDRSARIRGLMSFIKHSRLLNRVPQASRRRSSRDGEKAKAAIDSWDYQNRSMEHLDSHSPKSLLADSIHSLTHTRDGEDAVRSFFRHQTPRLAELSAETYALFRRASASSDAPADVSGWVLEVNRIFIIILRAASLYRSEEADMYEIDEQRPAAEFWTASDAILDALEELYTTTWHTLLARSRLYGTSIDAADRTDQNQKDQTVLKTQSADLAAVICANMEDKIRTHSQREMNGGADPNDGIRLKRRWDEIRPKTIRPLVEIGRVDEAYALAEHHRDFETSVMLCHDPKAGRPKVQAYIETFGEDFAFVSYLWYIEKQRYNDSFNQDEVYGSLSSQFFEVYSYPDLAWMHHVACGRYGSAAQSLMVADRETTSLDDKHLISSIGKLAAVAEIKAKGDVQQRQLLGQIDDELDGISIQNDLRETLTASKSSDKYLSEISTRSQNRPMLHRRFIDSAKSLAAGQASDIEDSIDVLTLKDNRGDFANDPTVALGRLINDTTSPEGRKQVALVSTWRRIYIRDDWSVVADTKGRSEEAQRDTSRATLTYQTLKATEDDAFPPAFIISPYDAMTPPYTAESSARYPSWDGDSIAASMADHETEIATLRDYIEDHGSERLVRECGELVRRDRTDGDVEM